MPKNSIVSIKIIFKLSFKNTLIIILIFINVRMFKTSTLSSSKRILFTRRLQQHLFQTSSKLIWFTTLNILHLLISKLVLFLQLFFQIFLRNLHKFLLFNIVLNIKTLRMLFTSLNMTRVIKEQFFLKRIYIITIFIFNISILIIIIRRIINIILIISIHKIISKSIKYIMITLKLNTSFISFFFL